MLGVFGFSVCLCVWGYQVEEAMKGIKLSDCSIYELIKGGEESLTAEDSRLYRMIDYFFPIQIFNFTNSAE
ncbi:hypothetical protein QJS10_CPA06g00612 [Acorus calamus]|uniref:Uncharacterized protein n=1 Tax=Acorus calamus TaxID=4465 RepID=A0AAV9ERX5_ACOCL|nr:hypothetical protein QJS10_CPA06g00612 [Acorus calamus]